MPAKGPDGKQVMLLGLADAKQISDRPPLVVAPAVRELLPLMNGERTLEEIASQLGRGLTRTALEPLVAQLDAAGLLEGPTFDAMLARMRAQFDSSSVLPPGSTAAVADALVAQALGGSATEEQKREHGAARLREAMDGWIGEALKDQAGAAFATLPLGIIAPHIDYPRGWVNYAQVWGRMRGVDRPARVVILGTNHFGSSTGVCGCDKGFSTPLGECRADTAMVEGLRARLGERLYEHRYDHEREHSIELQAAWIQHCLGADEQGEYCRVFGALVHDPCMNAGESYDGKGVSLPEFVGAMREVIAELPGRTLIVGSADLSHVGPAFGDSAPLAGEKGEEHRNKVFAHDQEMLGLVTRNKASDLVSAMSWQGNPTRWCSIGNIVATMEITRAESVQVLHYAAAMDPQGMTMVSSVAAVLR